MLLECSLSNSQDKSNHSQWTNVFKPPITINQGDTIMLKNAFIDTRQANQEGDIIYEEDVIFKMQFGYWVLNRSNPDVGYAGGATADYDFYVARSITSKNLIIGSHTITIKKGRYSPLQLASEMSTQMEIINADHNVHFLECLNEFLLPTTDEKHIKGVFFPAQPLEVPPIPNKIILDKSVVVTDTLKSRIMDSTINVSWGVSNQDLDDNFVNYDETLKQYVITSNGSFLAFPTEETDVIVTVPLPGFEMFNQDDVAKIFNFSKPYFVGASQASIEYQDGKFQFQFLHTPYYDANSNIIVAWENNYKIDAQSGVFLTSLTSTPALQWEGLGFDSSVIVEDDTENFVLKNKLSRGLNITSGYFSLDAMIIHTKAVGMKIQNSVEFATETSSTNAIISANNYITSENGGFFIISVGGCIDTDYKEDDKVHHNIISVVSRQYDGATGMVSDWGQSSAVYTNNGTSFELTNVDVRIMNPDKSLVVGLGSSNSIFLEVVKKSQ